MIEHDEYCQEAAVHNPFRLSGRALKYRDAWTGFCTICQLPNGVINCAGADACGCPCHEDYGGLL